MSELVKQINIQDKNGILHQFEVKDAIARQEIDNAKDIKFATNQFEINETETDIDVKINIFNGATSTKDSNVGLVPKSTKNDLNKYLNGAGQWTNVIKTPIIKTQITVSDSQLTISPDVYTFTDYGKLPNTLTELNISIDENEECLYEIGIQFEVQTDLQCKFITTKQLKYSNWPDIFESDTVYQISIVNNCVSVGEFKDLEI